MLRIISISAVKTESARKDKKASRQYITVDFIDPTNPFLTGKRNIFQNHSADGKSAFWKGLTPEGLAACKGNLQGEIKTLNVKPYEITGADGQKRSVSTYKAVVFAHESDAQVAKAANHELVTSMSAGVEAEELAS